MDNARYARSGASRAALPWIRGAVSPILGERQIGPTFPWRSGESSRTNAAHIQLGELTRKAKRSCKLARPPKLREANQRCDAGLFGVSSPSLFSCSAQDVALAPHAFTELRRLARVVGLQTGSAVLKIRFTDLRMRMVERPRLLAGHPFVPLSFRSRQTISSVGAGIVFRVSSVSQTISDSGHTPQAASPEPYVVGETVETRNTDNSRPRQFGGQWHALS